jgi:methyl-accepting chemotaxis protein
MRLTIANKLFIGFLCVIVLNAVYFILVNKPGRIGEAVFLLGRQNDLGDRLMLLKTLQRDREAAALRYEKTAQRERPASFRDDGRVATGLLDTLRGLADSMVRLDAILLPPDEYGSIRLASATLADLLRSVDSAGGSWSALFERLIRLRDPHCSFKWSFSEPMLIGAVDSAAAILDGKIDSALSLAGHLSGERTALIGVELSREKRAGLAAMLFLTVFSVLFGLVFSRTITTSLRRLKESAGSVGRADFNVNPEGYPDDETGDLAAAFFDMAVSLRKKQEELIRSRELAAIGEIVASVNHEINNPLMIISGNAQFLEMSMAEYPESMRVRVRAILHETERIARITKKLREIKSPLSGNGPAAPPPSTTADTR